MSDEAEDLAASLEASLGLNDDATASPAEGAARLAADGAGLDGAGDADSRDRNLNLILDIPLKVTVELGRTRMRISQLLSLGQGSVIELQKLAGEPMEVLVNNKLVASGEAVVVNEKFGVRIKDILSQLERVEKLGGA